MNIKKLEEKFNLTTEEAINTIKKIDDEIKNVDSNIPKELENSDDIYNLELLKQDFFRSRSILLKLIDKGNEILSKVSDTLDDGVIKASTISALAELQRVIGDNLKNLVNLYKDINDLQTKNKNQINVQTAQTVNNIVFTGKTSDLIKKL